MTEFSEWQQLSQTKVFITRLEQSVAHLREEATADSDGLSIERIAIAAIEKKAEVRTLERTIEVLTSKEDEDDEQT